MNFQMRVEAARKDLTLTETKTANYILKHPQKAIAASINQLAELAGSSAATVTRMVRKLDIDSFTAMKIMISGDLARNVSDSSPQLDIKENESFSSICNKLVENDVKNINQTKDLLKKRNCEAVVHRLLTTKTLYVFGVGASSLAAENIYQKWSRIGFHVVFDQDINVFLAELSNATEEDTLWLISNSGETPEILWLANYAKKHGIFTIALTRFGQNRLAKKADIALITCKPIEPDVRVGATNSITGQFYVVDVVFYLYFSRDFNQSFKAITTSRQSAENYKSHFKIR